VRRSGGGWVARCPAHEDRSPSLSVKEGVDGRVLVYCHAGSRTDDVVAAIGLTMRDLFADSRRQL
jgi:putative DNA primase/helicase